MKLLAILMYHGYTSCRVAIQKANTKELMVKSMDNFRHPDWNCVRTENFASGMTNILSFRDFVFKKYLPCLRLSL